VKTNSLTTEGTNINFSSSNLFYTLNSLVLKRYCLFFCLCDRKSAKKCIMMSFMNKIKKLNQSNGFRNIKRFANLENLHKFKNID